MTKLRCPYCNVEGLKNIGIHKAGFFGIVHCSSCGAIHGVVPIPNTQKEKEVQPKTKKKKELQETLVHQPTAAPKPKILKESKGPPTNLQHAALTDSLLLRITSDVIGEKAALTTNQLQHMYRNSDRGGLAPICPEHHIPLIRLTITHEMKYGQDIWACPRYDQCEHWEIVE